MTASLKLKDPGDLTDAVLSEIVADALREGERREALYDAVQSGDAEAIVRAARTLCHAETEAV
jgi:hypothetical protein